MRSSLSLFLGIVGFLFNQAFAGESKSFWLPSQDSIYSGSMDQLFYFILYVGYIFLAIVTFAMIFMVVKYRRKPGQLPGPTADIEGNHTLEVVWIVIPSLLLIVVFTWGFKVWVQTSIPPADVIDIRVTGQKWAWSYAYPKEGFVTADLVVPVGRAVKLTMHSQDVIHSFYVPDFRIKKDLLPKRYSTTWFETQEEGEHDILCTEYCGTAHSTMLGKLKVVSEAKYLDWVSKGGDEAGAPTAEKGKRIYESRACVTCHSLDGSSGIGPTWKGKYGSSEHTDKGEQLIDDNYITESIYNPMAKITKGYNPVMPSYKGQLSEGQIQSIIEFMKTLK